MSASVCIVSIVYNIGTAGTFIKSNYYSATCVQQPESPFTVF